MVEGVCLGKPSTIDSLKRQGDNFSVVALAISAHEIVRIDIQIRAPVICFLVIVAVVEAS